MDNPNTSVLETEPEVGQEEVTVMEAQTLTDEELEALTAPETEVPETPETPENPAEPAPAPTPAEVLAAAMGEYVASGPQTPVVIPPPKNHVEQKVRSGISYIILATELGPFLGNMGKIPQQQADLAKIIGTSFKVGEKVPEEVLFKKLVERAPEFPQLRNSRQHVTYLFKYYRGLKPQGNHAGFVSRNFLRQVNG